MDVASVMSAIGLWTAILAIAILVFWSQKYLEDGDTELVVSWYKMILSLLS